MSVDRAEAFDGSSATTTTSDPNYRWHNGKWWYWMPEQQHWMVWNGDAWQQHQPRARTQVRSFSYQQPLEGSVGMPSQRSTTTAPRSNSGRITHSRGHRDAGSKVRGNY